MNGWINGGTNNILQHDLLHFIDTVYKEFMNLEYAVNKSLFTEKGKYFITYLFVYFQLNEFLKQKLQKCNTNDLWIFSTITT